MNDESRPLSTLLRDARGASSADALAVKVGVSTRTIYSYEAGDTVPKVREIRAILRATGVDEDYRAATMYAWNVAANARDRARRDRREAANARI